MAMARNELTQLAAAFHERLLSIKSDLGATGFHWYPFDVLAGIPFLERLLAAMGMTLTDLVRGRPVVDMGCADGEMAFFLETIGCAVAAVDYAGTNFNSMQGVEALKAALRSTVAVHNIDIEHQKLSTECGLVLLLGTLHHLKNPFLMLDRLTQVADYCFLSTRVARFAPDGAPIAELPIAYLRDPSEAAAGAGPESRDDATIYWVFSEAGLARLVTRSGWDVCAWLNAGDTAASEPVRADRDERIFCVLRRRDLFTNGRLLDGWYRPEGERDGWRWTHDLFSVRFPTPSPGSVRITYFVPPERFQATGAFTLGAMMSGEVISSQHVEQAGHFQLDIPIAKPPGAVSELTFWVSPAAAATGDERLLGVIVRQILFTPMPAVPTR